MDGWMDAHTDAQTAAIALCPNDSTVHIYTDADGWKKAVHVLAEVPPSLYSTQGMARHGLR